MRKPIGEMTEREMLTELLTEKRRAENLRYVKLGCCVLLAIAVAVLCAVYLPPVIAFFKKLYDAVQQIQQAVQQLQSATDSVRNTVVGLGETGSEALESALGKLNELLEKVPRIFR